jgi:fibronectin type 3 domain-containing protein
MNAFLFPEEEYPYMDTFCYIKDDWAYNYEPGGVYWKFINTDGTYEIHDWD